MHEAAPRLNSCQYLGEGEAVRPLMQQLTASSLLADPTVQPLSRTYLSTVPPLEACMHTRCLPGALRTCCLVKAAGGHVHA